MAGSDPAWASLRNTEHGTRRQLTVFPWTSWRCFCARPSANPSPSVGGEPRRWRSSTRHPGNAANADAAEVPEKCGRPCGCPVVLWECSPLGMDPLALAPRGHPRPLQEVPASSSSVLAALPGPRGLLHTVVVSLLAQAPCPDSVFALWCLLDRCSTERLGSRPRGHTGPAWHIHHVPEGLPSPSDGLRVQAPGQDASRHHTRLAGQDREMSSCGASIGSGCRPTGLAHFLRTCPLGAAAAAQPGAGGRRAPPPRPGPRFGRR